MLLLYALQEHLLVDTLTLKDSSTAYLALLEITALKEALL